MPLFCVRLEGRRWMVRGESGLTMTGFFATRCVRAGDEASARQAALRMVRDDLAKGPIVEGTEGDLQTLEAWRCSPWRLRWPKGFTWYPEEFDA